MIDVPSSSGLFAKPLTQNANGGRGTKVEVSTVKRDDDDLLLGNRLLIINEDEQQVVDDEIAVGSKYLSVLARTLYPLLIPYTHILTYPPPEYDQPCPQSSILPASSKFAPTSSNQYIHSQTGLSKCELQDVPLRLPQHHPAPITGLCRTSRSCPTKNVRKETGRAQWGYDRQGQDVGL